MSGFACAGNGKGVPGIDCGSHERWTTKVGLSRSCAFQGSMEPFFVLGTRGGTIFRRGNRNGITADHKTLLSLFSPMSSKGRNHLCWHTRGNGGTHFFLFREPTTSKMFGPIFRTNCPGDRCRYPSSNERIYGCVSVYNEELSLSAESGFGSHARIVYL